MKKLLNYKSRYAGVLILALYLLSACSNELKYDVAGDTTNRVYVNVETVNANTYNFSIVQTPISSIGTITAVFPARGTQAAITDLKVTFAVDHSLVDAYNAAHSTTYSQVSDSILTLVNTTLTIPKGGVSSVDSINVSITNARLKYLTAPGYLLPIRINTVSTAENTAVSSNQNIVYLLITTSWTNCYNSPLITDMVGTLITPRTTWTATLDQTLVSGTLPQMFDGSTTTYWRITPPVAPAVFNLVVDIKTAYTTITGIRINSNSTSYGLTQVKVYSSTDGTTWVYQGNPTLSTANAYQYIKFYQQISARYLKIQSVTPRSTSRVYGAEFDVYKN
jgi:hypothetical protein